MALGILATILMTKADFNIKVTVEDNGESRRLILGPRFQIGVVYDHLLGKTKPHAQPSSVIPLAMKRILGAGIVGLALSVAA